MTVAGEYRGARLRAPPAQSGVAIGRITNQCKVVGNRGGRHPELCHDPRFIPKHARPPIQLHHARPADALREILVWCADDDAFHPRVRRRRRRPCGQCIVGLELDHRPDDDACRLERGFKQGELCEQVGLNARPGLVARPQSVAERFDHVVGGNGHMGGPGRDHSKNG
jgi:hypothetical protein